MSPDWVRRRNRRSANSQPAPAAEAPVHARRGGSTSDPLAEVPIKTWRPRDEPEAEAIADHRETTPGKRSRWR